MADSQFLSDAYARLRAAVDRLAESGGEDSSQDSSQTGSQAGNQAGGDSQTGGSPTLPPPAALAAALAALPRPGQADYLQPRGARATLDHLVDAVVPALNGQNGSGRYYGFVTGSALPVAEAADNVVSALDQNLHARLPSETAAAAVEDAALAMLADVLDLGPADAWPARLFTTGATASNVLGLALGREALLRGRLRKRAGATPPPDLPVSELGLLRACRAAGVDDVRILASQAHSSLYKAASIVGLGRAAVVDLPHSAAEPWRLSLDAVERALAAARAAGDAVVHIVSVGAGEINSGRFATTGRADMLRLRALADEYGAWIHVDGAFGLFARALPDTPEFARLRQYTEGLELADSIASDAHKLLNAPYDAGIFFSRHAGLQSDVFQNANAAYLGATATPGSTPGPAAAAAAPPSPMNMGIENSRRFRALPVYAILLSEGRSGLAAMLARMVRVARGVRRLVAARPAQYALFRPDDDDDETHISVLFWARHPPDQAGLAARINASRQVYVSPTVWDGRPACRVAVSSWRADPADLAVVERVLAGAAAEAAESAIPPAAAA